MKAREVATIVIWGLIAAILGGIVTVLLFGWNSERVGGGVIGGTVGAGVGGAWAAYSSIKKRRGADRVAGRVDVPPSV